MIWVHFVSFTDFTVYHSSSVTFFLSDSRLLTDLSQYGLRCKLLCLICMTRSFTWVTGSFLTNLGLVRMFVDGSMMTRLFMTHKFSTGCRWTQKLNKEDDRVTGLTSTGVLLTGYFLLLLKSKHFWKTTNYTSIGYVYPILVWHESPWHIPLSSDLRITTMSPWQLSPFFFDSMIWFSFFLLTNAIWRGISTRCDVENQQKTSKDGQCCDCK